VSSFSRCEAAFRTKPEMQSRLKPSFRRTSRPPAALSLYKSDLRAKDVVEIEAIRVTSVRRTLQDVAEGDLLSRDQLQGVLKQALAVGLVDVQFLTGLTGDQFEFRFDQ
jgi:hypothetical protein